MHFFSRIPFSWTDAYKSLLSGIICFALIIGGLWSASFNALPSNVPALHTMITMGLWASGTAMLVVTLRRLAINVGVSRLDLTGEYFVVLCFGLGSLFLSVFVIGIQTAGFAFVVHIFVCAIIGYAAVCFFLMTKIIGALYPSRRP